MEHDSELRLWAALQENRDHRPFSGNSLGPRRLCAYHQSQSPFLPEKVFSDRRIILIETDVSFGIHVGCRRLSKVCLSNIQEPSAAYEFAARLRTYRCGGCSTGVGILCGRKKRFLDLRLAALLVSVLCSDLCT